MVPRRVSEWTTTLVGLTSMTLGEILFAKRDEHVEALCLHLERLEKECVALRNALLQMTQKSDVEEEK